MLVLKIAFCIGMEGKMKKSATSVILHDGKARKRNCLIRFLLFPTYSEVSWNV